MRRDPDAEDGDINGSDDYNGTPLDVADSISMFGDECDSVDDDLHEQLNLKDPEEEDEKQHWNAVSCC